MPAGRPTKYKSEYCKKALDFCSRMPFLVTDVAKMFDVAVSTIEKWMIEYPEFSEAIKRGREEHDKKVEQSLFERAMGYEHPEEKIFNDQGKILRAQTIKHYPPDSTAMIFWLKNRQPEKWRDKKNIDVDGELKINLVDSFATDNDSI